MKFLGKNINTTFLLIAYGVFVLCGTFIGFAASSYGVSNSKVVTGPFSRSGIPLDTYTKKVLHHKVRLYDVGRTLGNSTRQSSVESPDNDGLVTCVSNRECNNGNCVFYDEGVSDRKVCECESGWITYGDSEVCSYKQKDKLIAFLLSFFVGEFGADWFYLYRENGSGGYIAAGIFKILTAGGLGIWWLIDWIRILADAFPDALDAPLSPW